MLQLTVMRCGATEATGLSVVFFCCYQRLCVVSQQLMMSFYVCLLSPIYPLYSLGTRFNPPPSPQIGVCSDSRDKVVTLTNTVIIDLDIGAVAGLEESILPGSLTSPLQVPGYSMWYIFSPFLESGFTQTHIWIFPVLQPLFCSRVCFKPAEFFFLFHKNSLFNPSPLNCCWISLSRKPYPRQARANATPKPFRALLCSFMHRWGGGSLLIFGFILLHNFPIPPILPSFPHILSPKWLSHAGFVCLFVCLFVWSFRLFGSWLVPLRLFFIEISFVLLVCFVAVNPCVLLANRVDLGCFVSNIF